MLFNNNILIHFNSKIKFFELEYCVIRGESFLFFEYAYHFFILHIFIYDLLKIFTTARGTFSFTFFWQWWDVFVPGDWRGTYSRAHVPPTSPFKRAKLQHSQAVLGIIRLLAVVSNSNQFPSVFRVVTIINCPSDV